MWGGTGSLGKLLAAGVILAVLCGAGEAGAAPRQGANGTAAPAPAAPATAPSSSQAPSGGDTSTRQVNTIKEVFDALGHCWVAPEDHAWDGMEITVQLSFNRDGNLKGEPRFTYMTHSAPPAVRAAYQRAVVDMLKRCTPMPFTPSMANATAGSVYTFRITEPRVAPRRPL